MYPQEVKMNPREKNEKRLWYSYVDHKHGCRVDDESKDSILRQSNLLLPLERLDEYSAPAETNNQIGFTNYESVRRRRQVFLKCTGSFFATGVQL